MKTLRALALCLFASSLVAQTAALAPAPKFRQLDANGYPLAGGLVFTCLSGTACGTTPVTNALATYTDSTLGTANANPVVLDASGSANIWLGTGTYRIVVESSLGVVLVDTSGIASAGASVLTALAAGNGATLIGYTSSNAGAAPITVAAKLGQILNFADLGGVCDGTTDMTTKLQAAVNGLATGQTLALPQTGSCLISSPGISFTNLLSVSLTGGKLLSTATTPTWSFINLAGSTSNLTIRGVTFQGSATTGPASGPTQQAVHIPSTATGNTLHFVDNTVTQCNGGIQNSADLFNFGDVHDNTFTGDVDPSGVSGYADIYTLGKHWHIFDNWFINSPFQGVYLSGDLASLGGGASYATVENNTFINPGRIGLTTFSTSAEAPVTGNVFVHNHFFNIPTIAISADGTATGTIIAENDITGATGSFGSGQGVIQTNGANSVGLGESNVITGNTIKNSTGSIPPIWVTDGNHASITGNTVLNNPRAIAGILVTTIEGGTVITGEQISGNTISGGGANSITGPGTGAITYSIVAGNGVDGAILNIDPGTTAHNIVAGNGGAANPNWALITPASFGSATAAKSQVDVFGNVSVGAYAGVTAAPANGALISGQVGIGDSAPAAGVSLSVGGSSGTVAKVNIGTPATDASEVILQGTSTGYNFAFGNQLVNTNCMDFIPSTAVGGLTFTTPVFTFCQNGATFIPSIKATTGTPYVCVNSSGQLVKSATACSGT